MAQPVPPDADLVARLSARDESAFCLVVDAWSPGMLRLARSLVSTQASAEEVLQDTWPLESDTEQQILDHLAECDGCQAHLDQMQATIRALGEVPAGRLPEDTRATLLEAFRRAPD